MSPDQRFHTTKWSMILAASRTGSDFGTREALANLCEAYWYPVFAFVRRSGRSREDALDLTQGYFAGLLERGLLETADPARGRFRSFMLATVKHFLSNERRREAAVKRGGTVAFVTLDSATEHEQRRSVSDENDSPERAFEREWALTVFHRARRRLEREFNDAGKTEQFRLLQGHLSGEDTSRSYADIASELRSTEAAIKMAVRRLRQRFGKLLREEITQTLDDESDMDAEVQYLLSVI